MQRWDHIVRDCYLYSEREFSFLQDKWRITEVVHFLTVVNVEGQWWVLRGNLFDRKLACTSLNHSLIGKVNFGQTHCKIWLLLPDLYHCTSRHKKTVMSEGNFSCTHLTLFQTLELLCHKAKFNIVNICFR